ncbi:MAG: glycosyltransferase family A protein [Ignavibacteria bacterium]|jgi:glycosyltransferase involved in cell wall biosynthesis
MKLTDKKVIVSVIITVFNRKDKILRAINSVLNQTFEHFEIIIVDDGSTDRVENILFPLLKKYDNIKYLRHSNRNTAYSLNSGIQIAEGEYITFLDSDDEYEKDHLDLRTFYFHKNPDVDLIHTTCKFIGKKDDLLVPDVRDQKRLIHLNKCIIGATFFGKKKAYGFKGFKNCYGYDYEFYNRIKAKFNVKKLDIPTYIYHRESKDSVLTKMKNKMLLRNNG